MKCPHCEWPLDYNQVYQWFVGHDYSTDFQHCSPRCRWPMTVHVVAVPEFHILPPKGDRP